MPIETSVDICTSSLLIFIRIFKPGIFLFPFIFSAFYRTATVAPLHLIFYI
jgi:hypothetical protein